MRNFFVKIAGLLLKILLILVVLFFVGISIHSGKFPPTLKITKDYAVLLYNLAGEYTTQLITAKDKYSALLKRCEVLINKESGEMASAASGASLDDTTEQIEDIKVQLDRIEEQNKLILNALRK